MAESFHLLRDPGFNVAYWNLPTRAGLAARRALVGQRRRPLRLFHFSGFDAAQAAPALQAPEPDPPRATIRISRELCAEYAAELLAAGADEVSSLAVHLRLDAARGSRSTASLRRSTASSRSRGSTSRCSPQQGEADFVAAAQRAGRRSAAIAASPAISRRCTRGGPTSSGAFPDLAGADADGYLAWVADARARASSRSTTQLAAARVAARAAPARRERGRAARARRGSASTSPATCAPSSGSARSRGR